MLYAKVAGPAHATTRAETLKAFQTLKTPVNVGTIAPYKVVGAKPPKGFPRIFNPTITTGYVEHGKILSNGEGFTDPFTELANLAKG